MPKALPQLFLLTKLRASRRNTIFTAPSGIQLTGSLQVILGKTGQIGSYMNFYSPPLLLTNDNSKITKH